MHCLLGEYATAAAPDSWQMYSTGKEQTKSVNYTFGSTPAPNVFHIPPVVAVVEEVAPNFIQSCPKLETKSPWTAYKVAPILLRSSTYFLTK